MQEKGSIFFFKFATSLVDLLFIWLWLHLSHALIIICETKIKQEIFRQWNSNLQPSDPLCSSLQPHLDYRTMPLSSTRTVGPFQAGSDPGALQWSPTTNLDQDPDIPRACTSKKSWLARLGFKPHATGNSKKRFNLYIAGKSLLNYQC